VANEFRIPELGENVAGGDVVRILVNVGDTLTKDQGVLELETDKATIEVPSSVSGVVTALHIKEGDKVTQGQLVLEVAAGAAAAAEPPKAVEASAATPALAVAATVVAPVPVPAQFHAAPVSVALASADARGPRASVVSIATARPAPAAALVRTEKRAPVAAAPSVRRLARELGVDVHDVAGSGPHGRISAEDVVGFVRSVVTAGGSGGGAARATAHPLPDFSRFGAIERKPMRGIRRKTAEHLSHAWTTIPHVTQFDKADVTALEALRGRFGKRVEAGGGKLTVTAIAVKIAATALRVFPQFNVSVDESSEEIVQKQYVHVGVAVDTDRGLLVPVIRDADRKGITQIASEIALAADRARTKKTTLEEMEGGCFTITNLGGIGGTSFTPIINHPEVAILGISRGSMEPVYIDGAFQPRVMLPLSLSYDHRVIDGADGIRFLRWIVEALEQPFLLSLEG
jgi:pyruvate dehydrogenase E2 component (dihydrolipoamide acetyltransferase)